MPYMRSCTRCISETSPLKRVKALLRESWCASPSKVSPRLDPCRVQRQFAVERDDGRAGIGGVGGECQILHGDSLW